MDGHRLFFALAPAAATRSQLVRAAGIVQADCCASGRAIAAEQLHLTLAFLGEYADPKIVAHAVSAGERARGAAFEVAIDHAASFGPTWYLGARAAPPELVALNAALRAELTRAGFVLERRAFHPHVTFVRKAARPALAPLPIAPIRWPVQDFVLYDSRPTERRYVELGRWPLGSQ